MDIVLWNLFHIFFFIIFNFFTKLKKKIEYKNVHLQGRFRANNLQIGPFQTKRQKQTLIFINKQIRK